MELIPDSTTIKSVDSNISKSDQFSWTLVYIMYIAYYTQEWFGREQLTPGSWQYEI